MHHRLANLDDAIELGALNHLLIQDEGHRNPMTEPELADRMKGWLSSGYVASVFEEDFGIVAYALYREESDGLHLRQFFVDRAMRRSGIGRRCMRILFEDVWPRDKRITVDVLMSNSPAISFWREVGFSDYCLTLERPARTESKQPNKGMHPTG